MVDLSLSKHNAHILYYIEYISCYRHWYFMVRNAHIEVILFLWDHSMLYTSYWESAMQLLILSNSSPCPSRAWRRLEIICEWCANVYCCPVVEHVFTHKLNSLCNLWGSVVCSHQIWRELVQRWASIHIRTWLTCTLAHARGVWDIKSM
jgi:hypothetical protein